MKKSNKILNFKLIIKNNNIELTSQDKQKKHFSFSLEEDDCEELKLFINYILDNIEKYDSLEIMIEKTDNYIHNQLSEKFKEIWEADFKKIKDDIKSCETIQTK